MRKLIPALVAFGIAISSCQKDDDVPAVVQKPVISITTPTGGFTLDNVQWLRIKPNITGDSTTAKYLWTINNDTVSTSKDLLYLFQKAGTYTVALTATNSVGSDKKEITVTVAEKTYTSNTVKVLDYLPAPGQFVNGLPQWIAGDKKENMIAKAQGEIDNGGMITLGGFGGYVVMGFDHPILNKPGQNSFIIEGNAFNEWSEPGIIQVAIDANGNGLADDEWYEIAGSDYNSPETVHNYTITYFKPDENKVQTPDGMFMSDTTYIRWKDNQGGAGYLSKNIFNAAPYYPQWSGDSISFTGTKLTAANVYDRSGDGSYYVSQAFSYGYADNWSNDNAKAVIRISWAVDKRGNYVQLPGIDFIKVATGIRSEAGWLGEVSTEVTGVKDLNIK